MRRGSCAVLIVIVLTLVGASSAGATIAWQPVPREGYRAPLRVMADDGSGVHDVTRRARGFALAPAGDAIAFEALGGVLVRGTAVGAAPARLLRKGATIAATAWAPDGRALALGAGRTVRVVDRRGRVASSFRLGGRGAITGLAFSPDGRRVAVTVGGEGVRERLVVARRDGRGERRAVTLRQLDARAPLWGPGAIALVAGQVDEADFAGNTTSLHTYVVAPDLRSAPVRLRADEPAYVDAPDGAPVRFTADGRLLVAGGSGTAGCLFDLARGACDDTTVGLQDLGPDGMTRLVLTGDAGIRDLGLLPAGVVAPTRLALPGDEDVWLARWRG